MTASRDHSEGYILTLPQHTTAREGLIKVTASRDDSGGLIRGYYSYRNIHMLAREGLIKVTASRDDSDDQRFLTLPQHMTARKENMGLLKISFALIIFKKYKTINVCLTISYSSTRVEK